jgi:hypothetical protein
MHDSEIFFTRWVIYVIIESQRKIYRTMSVRLTTKDFITRSTAKHGGRFDYSLVDYVNAHTKVKIICADHGRFEQTPYAHSRGDGCPVCADTKLGTDTFIKKATAKHNDKYDYSLVEYVNAKTKVKIICSKHGIFEQTPGNHLNGRGCPECGFIKFDNAALIKRFREKHNDKYDYSLVDYVSAKTKVTIICPQHGQFEQTPDGHGGGAGCSRCGGSGKLDTESFIKMATEKHNGKYDYSLVDYVKSQIRVKIVCSVHGQFEQKPDSHLQGRGCPGCAKNGYDPAKPGRLYYVMFDFGHTILYKIGITNRTVKQRFARESVKPIVLWESTFSDGRIARKVEADKKKEYSEYLYNGTPLLRDGNSECFTVDIMSFGRSTRVPLAV